jgi:hypothetical protein
VDQAALAFLAEQVHAEIPDLRKFYIQPFLHRAAGQLAHHELGWPLQEQLQGYVVWLHRSVACISLWP